MIIYETNLSSAGNLTELSGKERVGRRKRTEGEMYREFGN